jgi:hypothetical protein
MDNFLNGITLLGIPSLVLVPLLVQALKAAGLPVKWAGLAAIVVGLAVAGLAEAVTVWPQVTPVVRWLVAGLLLGLASAGAYSQYRIARNGAP